jgi:hypothetical protein
MIYDPKRPIVVQPVRDSPRGDRSNDDMEIAERFGRCVQCRQPYFAGDLIIVNRATFRSGLPIGTMSTSDGWHPICWDAAHEESSDLHRARLLRARPAGVLVALIALGLAACSPAPNSKPEVWKPPAYAKPVREPKPVRTLTTYGVGNSSCGTWTQDRATAANAKANARGDPMDRLSALTDETWVTGFVSGYSHGASLKDTDGDALAAFMDNYCQVHPLDTIATAAAALVTDLAQQ